MLPTGPQTLLPPQLAMGEGQNQRGERLGNKSRFPEKRASLGTSVPATYRVPPACPASDGQDVSGFSDPAEHAYRPPCRAEGAVALKGGPGTAMVPAASCLRAIEPSSGYPETHAGRP